MDENKPVEAVESYVVPDKEFNKYEFIQKRRSEGAKMQQIADEMGVSLQYAYKIIRQNEAAQPSGTTTRPPADPRGQRTRSQERPE